LFFAFDFNAGWECPSRFLGFLPHHTDHTELFRVSAFNILEENKKLVLGCLT
jgi:hypothetical protein